MKNMDKEYCAKIVANWLKEYDNEVVFKVMKNYNNIINDNLAYKLLSDLYEEESKDFSKCVEDIKYMADYGIEAYKDLLAHTNMFHHDVLKNSLYGIESYKELVRHPYSIAKDLRNTLYNLYIK